MASPPPPSSLRRLLLPFLTLVSLSPIPTVLSQACSATNSLAFPNTTSLYSNCVDLSTLGASLHYTYDPTNSTLSIAFIATPPSSSGWISWALNPNDSGMIGAQALIAFKDNSGALVTKTYDMSSYLAVVESPIVYETWDRTAEVTAGGVMRLSGKLRVGADEVTKGLNQVWQVGGSVVKGVPQKHDLKDENMKAMGVLDLVSDGTTTRGSDSSGGSRTKRKNIHGILNVVSWGVPIGFIMARYLWTFPSADPIWFYLHVFCQFSAYFIGVGLTRFLFWVHDQPIND